MHRIRAVKCDNKDNSAQLELGLGLSLAIENKQKQIKFK
jgi:hypothetical protein